MDLDDSVVGKLGNLFTPDRPKPVFTGAASPQWTGTNADSTEVAAKVAGMVSNILRMSPLVISHKDCVAPAKASPKHDGHIGDCHIPVATSPRPSPAAEVPDDLLHYLQTSGVGRPGYQHCGETVPKAGKGMHIHHVYVPDSSCPEDAEVRSGRGRDSSSSSEEEIHVKERRDVTVTRGKKKRRGNKGKGKTNK